MWYQREGKRAFGAACEYKSGVRHGFVFPEVLTCFLRGLFC